MEQVHLQKVLFNGGNPHGAVTLKDWLSAAEAPVETRCGGRGLCRSCQVLLNGEEVKSCQVKVAELLGAQHEVCIPKREPRAIHAVSDFWVDPKLQIQKRKGYGVAMDIGTTTVVATLWDLSTPAMIKTISAANAQKSYGDNVLSRISHSTTEAHGVEDLQRTLVEETLNPLLESLTKVAKDSKGTVSELVIAGNPTMLMSLKGQSLKGLACYPFTTPLSAEHIDAKEIGLSCSGAVVLLPAMGPFVGADLTAGALATSFWQKSSPSMFIDFGTNGEILLNDGKGNFWATATAVGPAFEGGVLSCGMMANDAAVHHISVEQGQWKLKGRQSSTDAYVGIAGSAYVDYLAEAIKIEWLSKMGRLTQRHDCELSEKNGCVHHLSSKISISEVDVAELIKAKAAIQAGIHSLLEVANIEVEDLNEVLVAGGFGYHMNLANAITLGLLPRVPLEKINVVGNSSLGGAVQVLLHPPSLEISEEQCRRVKVLELNELENFEDEYIDAMALY